ncbi:hypothetical protein EVAR_32723_1 [Eumeta japonica]|uniref:Uncharacterized protein n=1 Tax=Eumeta variegata TaxID=151549 RepID=A0A4C1ZCK4_EUMVA|nr:hypothetical protein EVAR_32723_1 [Eumeta japonica]
MCDILQSVNEALETIENECVSSHVKTETFSVAEPTLLNLPVENGKLCISGGRDRSLILWDMSTIKPADEFECIHTSIKNQPAKICADAHLGWVWDLAADSENAATTVYSASWDNTVKAWDLNNGLAPLQTFQCGMSALSVVTSSNLVMAGLYSQKVLIFDIRAGPSHIASYKAHRGPVLALDTYKSKVASVSEDKTLAIWDVTAGKILASDIKTSSERPYPVCISWSPAALYIGDSKGALHLVDPEHFKYVERHDIWITSDVTQPSNKIRNRISDEGKSELMEREVEWTNRRVDGGRVGYRNSLTGRNTITLT